MVAEKKILNVFVSFVQKIFGISEPWEQTLKRPIQGTFLQKISFLGTCIIVSEKIFKELLMHTCNAYELP
jgi:hypothetical protein